MGIVAEQQATHRRDEWQGWHVANEIGGEAQGQGAVGPQCVFGSHGDVATEDASIAECLFRLPRWPCPSSRV